jgi:cytochrome c oxidase assembly factor CtaG
MDAMRIVGLSLPVVLSFLLLAAHFSRAGHAPLTLVALFLPALLAVRRPWAAKVMQLCLVLGGAEWLRTMIRLVGERRSLGEPFARLVIILSAVAGVTVLSALVFRNPAFRERFAGAGAEPASSGGPG